MKVTIKLLLLYSLITCSHISFSQKMIASYQSAKNDSLRIGTGQKDYLPYIQSGYTLMLPEDKSINGTLIFLEDSGYDKMNKYSKQLYKEASKNGFAVLSVSTELPFDFYFSKSSSQLANKIIEKTFTKHNLPNKNIFFLGTGLVGHRAMRFIKTTKEEKYDFQLNIKGIVICNFTMDWTRKWYQHKREFRIKRNNLWEPKFINYMLETHLKGTPQTNPKSYIDFSAYSYGDNANKNILIYKNYAVLAYIEPAIKYGLEEHLKTLYENNATDMVGFLAELNLADNKNTKLIVLQPHDNPSSKKNPETTWNAINKKELLSWLVKQTN